MVAVPADLFEGDTIDNTAGFVATPRLSGTSESELDRQRRLLNEALEAERNRAKNAGKPQGRSYTQEDFQTFIIALEAIARQKTSPKDFALDGRTLPLLKGNKVIEAKPLSRLSPRPAFLDFEDAAENRIVISSDMKGSCRVAMREVKDVSRAALSAAIVARQMQIQPMRVTGNPVERFRLTIAAKAIGMELQNPMTEAEVSDYVALNPEAKEVFAAVQAEMMAALKAHGDYAFGPQTGAPAQDEPAAEAQAAPQAAAPQGPVPDYGARVSGYRKASDPSAAEPFAATAQGDGQSAPKDDAPSQQAEPPAATGPRPV